MSVTNYPALHRKPTGAYPSPRHKLAAASPHVIGANVPSSFAVVPPVLQMWGNDTYGDCVSAEEAASKAMWSVMAGLPELLIPDNVLIQWARQNGFLNGANLTDVMDAMISVGITVNGVTYKDGPYNSVDWTNDAVLSSAIFTGPIKIGIAANQLQGVVGSSNGWFATGFRNDNEEDHSVALWGFGTVAECFGFLNVAPPSGANLTERAYLLFTWNTIGVIDQPSLLAICGEAWLRNPTTPSQVPPNPVPPNPVPPNPVPPNPSPTPVTYTMSGTFTGTIS